VIARILGGDHPNIMGGKRPESGGDRLRTRFVIPIRFGGLSTMCSEHSWSAPKIIRRFGIKGGDRPKCDAERLVKGGVIARRDVRAQRKTSCWLSPRGSRVNARERGAIARNRGLPVDSVRPSDPAKGKGIDPPKQVGKCGGAGRAGRAAKRPVLSSAARSVVARKGGRSPESANGLSQPRA
jgi:hypothetical protein